MTNRAVRVLVATVLASLVGACGPAGRASAGEGADELQKLRAEVAHLREENRQLRLSPSLLARQVQDAIAAGDEPAADASFKRLADNFPISNETLEMRKRLDAFKVARRADEEAAKRVASLGFRALPVTPTVSRPDTSMTLSSSAFTRRWIFDSWGEGWRFMDAEKDRRLLVTRLNVSSRQKEPALFGIAAYTADGPKLKRLGEFRYRFARWSDYGAYLGTHADYRNDFSHSWRIPFTAAISLSEQDMKRRPIYLVATDQGCHERHYERFGQPPIFYEPRACDALKQELAADDFKGGALRVLQRID